jgi:hypothetical protein
MYKFLQKNNKKLLAVFGVGLMIVFILPQVAFDKNRGTSREVVGHIGSEPIHAGEARLAYDQWRQLREQELTFVLGPVGEDIEKHPTLFVLLQKEAEQLGLRVPDAQVDETLRGIQTASAMRGRPSPNIQIKPALRSLMLVLELFQRVESGLKPSRPLALREAADQFQRVKINLVHYSAEDFKKDVPPLNEADVVRQFDVYKNADPGVAAGGNTFGFGYRIPAQVKLRYLTIPKNEVAHSVRKAKSEFDWQVAARIHYRENLADYPATQPAETQPASGPSTKNSATTTPTTGPTTKPFAEVQEQIIGELIAPDVENKVEEIANSIRDRISADFDATKSKSASAPADFAKPEYLSRIAQDIEKRHGVKLGISEINEPKSQTALSEIKGIGESFNRERSLAQFIMRWAQPLLPPAQNYPPGTLYLLEPSPLFKDVAGNVYLFQLTDAKPAHPPADMTAIRTKVEEDLRTRLAFENAVTRARRLQQSASTAPTSTAPTSKPTPASTRPTTGGRLASLAKSAGKDVFTTPEFFDRQGNNPERKPAVLIPQIELPHTAHDQLASEAFKLLMRATPDDPHPTATVELPTARRVAIIELADVQRVWNDEEQPRLIADASRDLTRRNWMRLMPRYFNYDAVKARLDYRTEHPGAAE